MKLKRCLLTTCLLLLIFLTALIGADYPYKIIDGAICFDAETAGMIGKRLLEYEESTNLIAAYSNLLEIKDRELVSRVEELSAVKKKSRIERFGACVRTGFISACGGAVAVIILLAVVML